jgi:hypothetical protein
MNQRSHTSRRNCVSHCDSLHNGIEICESRQLLSTTNTVSGGAAFIPHGGIEAAPIQQAVTISHYAPTGGWGIEINEVHRVGNELWVFGTLYAPPPEAIVTPAFNRVRDTASVSIGDALLPTREFVRDLEDPGSELADLKQSGTSELLFQRSPGGPNAWNQDQSEERKRTLVAEPVEAPSAPIGQTLVRDSENDASIQLLWDRRDAGSFQTRQDPHFRRYHILVESVSTVGPVLYGDQAISVNDTVGAPVYWPRFPYSPLNDSGVFIPGRQSTDAVVDGQSFQFGGSRSLTLVPGVYIFRVRTQYVPVPGDLELTENDSAIRRNMLATPWSEWSDDVEFSVLPASEEILTIPVSNFRPGQPILNWGTVENAVGYEVWVNNRHNGSTTLTISDITSTRFIPDQPLPWGKYRFWVRAVRPDGSASRWSRPRDFELNAPAVTIDRISNTIDRTPLIKWTAQDGAEGYRVELADKNHVALTPSARIASQADPAGSVYRVETTVSGTTNEFQISEALLPGTYTIRITATYPDGGTSTTAQHAFRIDMVSPPNLRNGPRELQWDMHPEANSVDVWVAYLGGGANPFTRDAATPDWRYITQDASIATSTTLPNDAPFGDYRAWVRSRYTNADGHAEMTEWSKPFHWHLAAIAPSTDIDLRYSGDNQTLSWSPETDAVKYDVLVAPIDPQGRSFAKTQVNGVPDTSLRLDEVTSLFPPGVPAGHFRFWVRAIFDSSAPMPRTDWSNWLDVTFDSPPALSATARPGDETSNGFEEPSPTTAVVVGNEVIRPFAPWPQRQVVIDDIIETVRQQPVSPYRPWIWKSDEAGTFTLNASSPAPVDAVASFPLITASEVPVDLEFVSIHGFRATNLVTGKAVEFDGRVLRQFNDSCEQFCWIPWMPTFRAPRGLEIELGSGVYEIQARVRHVPVLLSGNMAQSYGGLRLKEISQSIPEQSTESSVNMRPTPWSDWSQALVYSVLSDDGAVLPYGPAQTTDHRPSFNWGPIPGVKSFEVWIQNRTTKQRVVHQVVRNRTEFVPGADLPAGQYIWWVRAISWNGSTGDWSLPQQKEIFAPSVSVRFATETVDATPVVAWDAVAGARNYTVEVSNAHDGKVVYRSNPLLDNSHRIDRSLANGQYHVWVRADFGAGARSAVGKETSLGSFVRPTLQVGQKPSATLSSDRRTVMWNSVDGATRYEIWIDRVSETNGRSTQVVTDKNVYTTEFRLPASIDIETSDTFRVWVRAVRSEQGRESVGYWSDVLQMTSTPSDADLQNLMANITSTDLLDVVSS